MGHVTLLPEMTDEQLSDLLLEGQGAPLDSPEAALGSAALAETRRRRLGRIGDLTVSELIEVAYSASIALGYDLQGPRDLLDAIEWLVETARVWGAVRAAGPWAEDRDRVRRLGLAALASGSRRAVEAVVDGPDAAAETLEVLGDRTEVLRPEVLNLLLEVVTGPLDEEDDEG